jgi:hypothetical protein
MQSDTAEMKRSGWRLKFRAKESDFKSFKTESVDDIFDGFGMSSLCGWQRGEVSRRRGNMPPITPPNRSTRKVRDGADGLGLWLSFDAREGGGGVSGPIINGILSISTDIVAGGE